MGIPVTQRSAAKTLLLALPLLVLIVPQGTVERSLVPEMAFIFYMLLTLVAVIAQASEHSPALVLPRRQLNPLLLLNLALLLLLNPLWSLWLNNEPMSIVMTAAPFSMLGVFYLLALVQPSAADMRALVASCGVAGTVLGVTIIGNFFLSDLSWSAMRSTGIEGRRTLSLPGLPMGAVIALTLSVASSRRRHRRIWSVMALVCTVAILMTVARAMLLAYLLGSVVSLYIVLRSADRRTRRRMLRTITLGLTAVAFLGAPLLSIWLERIDPSSESDLGTILGRLDENSAFLDGFVASPLLGQGMGHLFTYPSDFDWMLRDIGLTVPHSHLFFMLGTGGLIGAALYYGTLAQGARRLFRAASDRRLDAQSHAVVAGSAGAFVTGILYTLTSTTFTALSYNILLAVLMFAALVRWPLKSACSNKTSETSA